MTQSPYDTAHDNEVEISFGDIIEYLKESWRWILVGVVAGPALALLLATWLGKYKAEIVIDNLSLSANSQNSQNSANIGLTFSDWRNLSENLPLLAGQLYGSNNLAERQSAENSWLTSPDWWSKNVTATYGLSKNDTKNLATVGDELKGESTKIVNLKITYESRNKDIALQRAGETVDFFRRGSLFMRLKSQLDTYQAETLISKQTITKDLLSKDIELRYLQERANDIQALINSDHIKKPEGKIIVDVRNGDAKYLPLETQLNAVKLEIDSLEESKQRLIDSNMTNDVLSQFVNLAKPLFEAEKRADGFSLMEKLMAIESQLRTQIPENEWVKRSAIERLRTDLISIQSRFTNQMPELSRTVGKSIAKLPALAGGLMTGLLLAMLGTLFARRYRQYQQSLNVSANHS